MAAATHVAVLGVLPAYLLGALALQVRADTGIGTSELGALLGLFYLAATLSAVPLGAWFDRLGPRPALWLSGCCSVAAVAGITLARGPLDVVPFVVLGGIGDAASKCAGNLALDRLPQHARTGFAFGVKQAAVPAATLLAGLSLPLVALVAGWRAAFAGTALLGVALLVWLMRRAAYRPISVRPAGGRQPGVGGWRAALVVAAGGLGAGVGATVAAFYVETLAGAGIAQSVAGVLLALGGAVSIIVRLVAGAASDRQPAPSLVPVAVMMLAGGLAAALFGVVVSSGMVAAALGTIALFGLAMGWNGLFHRHVVRMANGRPALASGHASAVMFLGATATPPLFGLGLSAGLPRLTWLGLGMMMALGGGLLWAAQLGVDRSPGGTPAPTLERW